MKRLIPVILVTVLAIAGCSASPTPAVVDEPTTASATTTPPVDTPEPPKAAGTRAAPYAYGTMTYVADNSIWEFTIHTPQTDANTWVAQAGEFNEIPAEGNTWVGANIKVIVRDIPETASAGAEPLSVGASLSPVFVGASGTVYDFWTINYPASFGGESWNSLPDAFVSAGMEWDKPFALQVPVAEVEGGTFAVQHSLTGKVVFFG